MAVSLVAAGTLSSTTTEQSLASTTVAGAYELHLDLNALTSGDTILFRLKEAIVSTGTTRSVSYLSSTGNAGGGVSEPTIKTLGPVGANLGLAATAQQTVGTSGVSIPWKLIRLG